MPCLRPLGQDARAAEPDDASAESTIEALEGLPGILAESADVDTKADVDSALASEGPSATVDVPRDLDDGVTLEGEHGTAVAIEVPGAGDAASSETVAPGTALYEGTDPAVDTAVQALDDGVRIMSVLQGPKAPTEYAFDLHLPKGARMVRAPAQTPGAPSGYLILVPDQLEPIAEIAAPWAVDANGNAVPVRYTVDSDTVVMHVDHDDAAYPIVADPTVRWGWSGYNVIFTRRDVDAVLRNFDHVRGAGAACVYVPQTPAKAACISLSALLAGCIRPRYGVLA